MNCVKLHKQQLTYLCESGFGHQMPCRTHHYAHSQVVLIQQNHCQSQIPGAQEHEGACETVEAHSEGTRLSKACTYFSSYLTLEAGRDMRAPASSASNLPNTGAPSPFGQRRTIQVTSPPQESPFFRMSSMTACQKVTQTAVNQTLAYSNSVAQVIPLYICSAASVSGHLTALLSICSEVTLLSSTFDSTSLTRLTYPNT